MCDAILVKARYNCATIAAISRLCAQYLRGKRQVIYGGQMIHFALLAKGSALYDENEIPDYDVLSPTNYADALEFAGVLLAEGLTGVSVVGALHVQTVRVRVGVVWAMDFSHCEPALFQVEIGSALEWDGMLYRSPYHQFFDQLRPFCLPLERMKVENVFYRWDKDYKRMRMLAEHYKLPKTKEPAKGAMARLVPEEVNGWYGALAVYGKLIGDNWLDFDGKSFRMPRVEATTDDSAVSSRFASEDEGFKLEHAPLIYVEQLSGEYRAPVADYLPARQFEDGVHKLTVGPEYYCTSPRAIAVRDTKYGRIVCCESVLSMLLYHWIFGNCASCGYYFSRLWDAYLGEQHPDLYPTVEVFGNPRAPNGTAYLFEHPQFGRREVAPSVHFDNDSVVANADWVPGDLYRMDGHKTNTDVTSVFDQAKEDAPVAGGGERRGRVVVYGLSTCKYSREAAKIPDAYVVMDDVRKIGELARKYNHRTVPIIFVDGKFVGGLDAFKARYPYVATTPSASWVGGDHYREEMMMEPDRELQGENVLSDAFPVDNQPSASSFIQSELYGSLPDINEKTRPYKDRLLSAFTTVPPETLGIVYEAYARGQTQHEVRKILTKLPTSIALEARAVKLAKTVTGMVKLYLLNDPGGRLKGLPHLDIGSMDGLIAKNIGRDLNMHTLCLDIDPKEGSDVEWITYDANGRIPLADGSVAFVTCLQVFHHVRDLDALLREITRVLKPGGLLCVKEHDSLNETSFKAFIEAVHLLYERINKEAQYEDIRYMSRTELAETIYGLGYEQMDSMPVLGDQRVYHTVFKRL